MLGVAAACTACSLACGAQTGTNPTSSMRCSTLLLREPRPAVNIAVCTGSVCESRCNFKSVAAFEKAVYDSDITICEINCMNMCKRGPAVRLVAGGVVTVKGRMNDLERKRTAFQSVASQARVDAIAGVARAIADGSLRDSHGTFAVTAHGPLPPSAM